MTLEIAKKSKVIFDPVSGGVSLKFKNKKNGKQKLGSPHFPHWMGII